MNNHPGAPCVSTSDPAPRRAALKTGRAPFSMTVLLGGERIRIFALIPRSHHVDEKQSRISILTEWIGMGRSGPQTSAKRQLWNCITLTMVFLSLLSRPGKSSAVLPALRPGSAALHAAFFRTVLQTLVLFVRPHNSRPWMQTRFYRIVSPCVFLE